MANNTYKKNLNLVTSSINSLNLSGDGHVYGQLYCEDMTVNDTLLTDNIVANDHLSTPVINTDEINTPVINTDGINSLNDDKITISKKLDMSKYKVVNVGTPEDADDVATKKYVDDNTSTTPLPSNLVFNPLSSDLDAAQHSITDFNNLEGNTLGSSITNITSITAVPNNDIQISPITTSNITSSIVQTDVINKTEAPTYFYFGNITPGNYVLAEIPDMTKAEGDITVHIRCLEPGKNKPWYLIVLLYLKKLPLLY